MHGDDEPFVPQQGDSLADGAAGDAEFLFQLRFGRDGPAGLDFPGADAAAEDRGDLTPYRCRHTVVNRITLTVSATHLTSVDRQR